MSAQDFHEPILVGSSRCSYRVLDYRGQAVDVPCPSWAVFVSWALRGDFVEFRASDGGLDWQLFGPRIKVLP